MSNFGDYSIPEQTRPLEEIIPVEKATGLFIPGVLILVIFFLTCGLCQTCSKIRKERQKIKVKLPSDDSTDHFFLSSRPDQK